MDNLWKLNANCSKVIIELQRPHFPSPKGKYVQISATAANGRRQRTYSTVKEGEYWPDVVNRLALDILVKIEQQTAAVGLLG